MADNKEQNKAKNIPKQKGYMPPALNNPKPFSQFSTQPKLKGHQVLPSAVHRRLNTRRSSGK